MISNFLLQPILKYSVLQSYSETLQELLPYPIHIHSVYTWYTDGSSLLYEGVCKAGYVIVSSRTFEAWALPDQQAELLALTCAVNFQRDNP